MTAITEQVVIQSDGVLEIRSPELHVGDTVEVIVKINSAKASDNGNGKQGSWEDFIGAYGSGGDPNGSDNESIDRDLAGSYADTHEPEK